MCIRDRFSTVDSTLAEWSHETDSRQAERRAIRGLREAIDRLLAGLDRLERELGVVQDAAETAEARNVGLLD